MKICEVVNNWPAETFIQRHLIALLDEGFNIQMVARHGDRVHAAGASIASRDQNLPGLVMPNYDHLGGVQKVKNLRYFGFGMPARSLRDKVLLGFFKRLGCDLIHFHDASLAASMCWIPNALGIPYTLSLRGSDIQVFTLGSTARRESASEAIRGAAGIHAVCRALGESAEELVGRNLDYSVIHTTVPIPPGLPLRNAGQADGQIHLMSSGRLMWRKGFDDLLVAIQCLRAGGMNARLTIIGAGPDLDQLLYFRRMLGLEDVVDLPGKLDYEQILALFAGADAYIQSSVAEGLSNSLAEAMANGLPVFATDVGGTQEVIEDGVTGFLLPALKREIWVEKLTLIQDGARMERVRFAAYKRAREIFSAEHHARGFAAFYEEAVRSHAVEAA